MSHLYCRNCGAKVPVKLAGVRTLGIGMSLFGVLGWFSFLFAGSGHAFLIACTITFIGIVCTVKAEEIAKSVLKDKGCPHCNQKKLYEEKPMSTWDDLIIELEMEDKCGQTEYTASEDTEEIITIEDSPSVNAQSIEAWDRLNGYPFYYFYYYLPKRYTNVTDETIKIRKMIYNFKDGVDYRNVKILLKSKLRATFGYRLSSIVFVCIPASSRMKSDNRYLRFSEEICSDLGMIDGYPHISFVQEKTPKHLGGKDHAIFSFDKNFFAYHDVILFDDVVTRGHSMKEFINALEGINAKVLCQIAIGKTYNDWYTMGNPVHPYTGNEALIEETNSSYVPF